MADISSEDLIQILKTGRNLVFLDSSRLNGEENSSYLFYSPETVLQISSASDIGPFFSSLELALSRGYYAAGWFSYELGYLLHKPLAGLLEHKSNRLPLAWLGLFRQPVEITSLASEKLFRGNRLSRGLDFRPRLSVTKKRFTEHINEIHEYIKSGDTYQVNYTVRSFFDLQGVSAFQLYCHLRNRQRVNYAAFIRNGAMRILCLSPELFFRKRGDRIWSKPMKGTVRRGRDAGEDILLFKFLSQDEKNRAENVMIVDLIRNDLGRICTKGTVRVPDLFKVEPYETLFQMISRVEGKVSRSFTWEDCFRALFPCGSITGAPKIRTMEIISELEDSPRGIYTGAIGFITPDHDACFNVAIRTIMAQGERCELGIGSGITIYSDPGKEFEETLLKAAFLGKDVIHD
ncbi:MAG: aminodeoxychorismate synthase component I [Thermodesulfatator sp.]|nr:MAG: aminodeoxychorismate synthase component I [Thermodesulfatator sp.]